MPANPSLPPLLVNVRRNPESAEQRETLPYQNHTLESIKEGEFADGLKFFTRGKFIESLEAFRKVFAKALLVVVKTYAEAAEVSNGCISISAQSDQLSLLYRQIGELVDLSREYVIGLMLETQRQRLVSEEPDNMSRNLDLAAFFTHCKLQPAHVQLALRSAMRVFAKAGNNSTAAVFARRLVDMKPADSKVVTSVSCIIRAVS